MVRLGPSTSQTLESTLAKSVVKQAFKDNDDLGYGWEELGRKHLLSPQLLEVRETLSLGKKLRPSGCFLRNVRREQISLLSTAGGQELDQAFKAECSQMGMGFDSPTFTCLCYGCLHQHITQGSLYSLYSERNGCVFVMSQLAYFSFCLRVRWIALDFPLPFCWQWRDR